ncbi:MAG TPA: hypothetical protein VK327_18805 [Candidatus Paceibacterota bacterium]|nr:hypothetical protein [Candidatus Paceibacterota bacterium]
MENDFDGKSPESTCVDGERISGGEPVHRPAERNLTGGGNPAPANTPHPI